MKRLFIIAVSLIPLLFLGFSGKKNADANIVSHSTEKKDIKKTRIGYEILQIKGFNKIVVWINKDLSKEAFEAIDLPLGWLKNQPREGEPDDASFARSPEALTDGEFTDKEHFGHLWRHNATVTDRNVPIPDAEGLIRGIRIVKYHEVTFNEGRTIYVLTAPTGEKYIRISRDAERKTDKPTIPSAWKLSSFVTQVSLTLQLPNPTLNLRMDNDDSFQGPIDL
ncbi:MAG: hypothetical protein AAFQ20_02705 [Bacteroidota bacterium]